MAPPVRVSQSWRGAPAVAPETKRPGGVALVDHDGVLGQRGPDRGGQGLRRASRSVERDARCGHPAGPRRGTQRVGQRREGRRASSRGPQGVDRAAGGDQVARLAGIGEEGHRRAASTSTRCGPVELGLGHLGEVGQALEGGEAGAPFEVGREGLAQHLGPGGGADALRRHGPAGAGPTRRTAPRWVAVGQDAGSVAITPGGRAPGPGTRGRGPPGTRRQVAPRDIGREDQGGDPAGRPQAAATASAASAPTSSGRPATRNQPETAPARASMSDSSGASSACGRWRGRRRC